MRLNIIYKNGPIPARSDQTGRLLYIQAGIHKKTRTIYINYKLSLYTLIASIIHEVMHGLLYYLEDWFLPNKLAERFHWVFDFINCPRAVFRKSYIYRAMLGGKLTKREQERQKEWENRLELRRLYKEREERKVG